MGCSTGFSNSTRSSLGSHTSFWKEGMFELPRGGWVVLTRHGVSKHGAKWREERKSSPGKDQELLDQSSSNFIWKMNCLEILPNCRFQFWTWGRAQTSAFPASSQVRPIQLVKRTLCAARIWRICPDARAERMRKDQGWGQKASQKLDHARLCRAS